MLKRKSIFFKIYYQIDNTITTIFFTKKITDV